MKEFWTRLKNAWRALWGKPPITNIVPGDPEPPP